MKRILNLLLLLMALSLPKLTMAQAYQTGFVYVGNTAGLPVGCLTGHVAFVTDATAGTQIQACGSGTWFAPGQGIVSGLSIGFLPKAGSANSLTSNSAIDDGHTVSGQITSTEPVNAPSLSTGAAPPTACGTAIGCAAYGEASGAATPTAGMDTIRASSTNHSFVCSFNGSAEGACNGPQYAKRVCPFAFGDGVNAITAATYPASGQMLQCVNNTGVTWTVADVHCFTDNAGTSTINVYNDAGTSLLTGAITCNATKTSGGAIGTLSGTTTIATTDGLNFVFVADGTTKYATVTVDFTY